MSAREELTDVLAEFARTMLTEFSIPSILEHLASRIVGVLPVDAAGVTLFADAHGPNVVAGSDGLAERLEHLQEQLGDGPCRAVRDIGRAVAIPNLSTDVRFPAYSQAAHALGVGAVGAIPLRHCDRVLGALDLYWTTPSDLSEESAAIAQTLADVAAAYVVNAQTRTATIRLAERHQLDATHDALTGLPNRVLLRERMEHAARRSQRSHELIAVLFLDLDRFKEINDRFGHAAGDAVLITIADRLRKCVRPGDTVARISGDEFVVMCEDLTEVSTAELLARRIVGVLSEPFDIGGTKVDLSASVGIAFAGQGDHLPEQLLTDADEAMYQAKRAGGNRHQLLDVRARSHSASLSRLQEDLHGALTREEFRLEHQPIVRTADGSIVGFESLLRWDHPGRGPVPPLTLIPIAEQTGLINDIGRWVLERSCRDRSRLLAGQHRDVPLTAAVNVSPRQLLEPGYVGSVAEALSDTGTDPRSLTLEITESIYLADSRRAVKVLESVKELGVRVALDDFGTGYSSLSNLQRFPADIVKIDHSFILPICHEPTSTAIVRAMVNLTHELECTVIAEGVETSEQREQLCDIGCDFCQGFYFFEPMSTDELAEHL